MRFNNKILFLVIILGGLIFNSPSYAQTEPPDESVLFTSVAPDALIVLDLSGSMLWAPPGERMYIHNANQCDNDNTAFYAFSDSTHDKACDIVDPYGTVPKYGDAACVGPFYRTQSGRTDCSRLAIAKRALFDILDDNDSNTITSTDEQTLNIRFGYMRFYKCSSDEPESYGSGCNSLIWEIASKYSRIYCNNNTSCSPSSSSSGSVSGESAYGGTPLASALNEAKLYLDYHKSRDSAASCRQKFVILITDGADTFACLGNGSENQTDQYKRRRETVAKAKALADAGYKVFVVGFGATMPHFLTNTFNWAAYYGQTDNPLVANSGSTSAYNPSSITSCQDDYPSSTPPSHNIGGDGDHYYATSNDPGEITLSGYAFLASSASDLTTALKQAIDMIREASYSFSLASVSSQRTQDENHLYEASFQPVNDDPFWNGHLKKYVINSNGSIGSEVWDAGTVLQTTSASSRTNMKTYKSGSLIGFTTTNITAGDLGVASDSARDAVVGYFRGEYPSPNPDNWKLGDIFHSNPVTIGTPSSFFEDIRDTNDAFGTHRTNHQRTSANGLRIIVAGDNAGQFHAFLTSAGSEAWSFIPPNFLPKLKNVAHSAHPTGLTHQYFVDGPVTAADVWLGSGSGTSKSDSDWKTLLIFGEGRGGGSYLWSSSSSCDSGLNPTYTSTYSYYCGYYAFDISDTLNPVYKWRINTTSSLSPYLGDPWSKMAIGRVKINGDEKWVGFVGGGYNASDCFGGGGCDSRGKSFYVVDLSDGSVLWSYTRSTNSNMNYSLPASPAIVDTDNDGFIDTAYLGDLGGSMWRFKFCTSAQGSTCITSDWSGGYLFQSSTGVIRPIFATPAVSKDVNGNLWVHWGTGDKTDPTAANAQEKFFAVKDNDRTTGIGLNDLDNLTSEGSTYDAIGKPHGWFFNLPGLGQKVLSDATVFGGVAYFTIYVPPQGSDPCSQSGEAKLYGVNFTTGAGVLTASSSSSVGSTSTTPVRSITIGTGIATTPVVSFKPLGAMPPDLYVTVSGGAGSSASTTRVNFDPPTLSNRTNLLYWKDLRLQ